MRYLLTISCNRLYAPVHGEGNKVDMRSGNLIIVQGGGPTAVLNSSLASAIAEGIGQQKIGRIFGARHGMEGLVRADLVELGQMTSQELQLLGNSPGAALGSSRFKPTEDDLEDMVGHLRRLDLRYMLFMGGNGTMRGAEMVSRFCREAGFEVQIVAVPKTVDNDIAGTDRCPGYASAARFVAQSTRDLGMDLRSLPQPVTILETMGRSVGWLAASATLGKVEQDDAPHLVYLPETPFHIDRFLSELDEIVTRQGWAVVVVSEGIREQNGRPVYEMKEPAQLDSLARPMTGGVGQFLATMVGLDLKIRCRSEKPGLLARASMVHLSAQDQLDAELVGRAGVRALASGETDKMVALRGLGSPAGNADDDGYDLVPLDAVTGVERSLPEQWLTGGPLAVGRQFRAYLQPLVGELCRYAPAFAPAIPGMRGL
jgi:ATP-dependent phosphofructokinase / diphosphate-dependent phosphofructokinase